MSLLKLRAKPVAAVAQVFPAATPKTRDRKAMRMSSPPYLRMTSMPHPACIWFTSVAIIEGMMHSRTTSTITKSGVSIAGFLNSRIL